MRTEKAQESIVDLVIHCLDPEAVYLFGSVTQGRARPDSDVDIMVVARFEEPRRQRGIELRGLLAANVLPVDLHFRTPEEFELECRERFSLADTVRRHGKLVYEKAAAQP